MAFDEGLAERIRLSLADAPHVHEKRMFGGLAFMVRGNMCVGVVKNQLMARVGKDQYETALTKPGANEMDFTGRPMKGMVFVSESEIAEDDALNEWVQLCLNFVASLPSK